VDKVLGELCADAGRRLNMSVDFSSRSVPRVVGTDTSVCLFRVLQEGLTNAARHSGTRRMRVTLWGTPGAIHLRIRDFGHGFSVEAATNGGRMGLGLLTMRERVALVNGTFSINSKPQRGTCIDVTVAVATPNEATRQLP
jgi:signal transduction histidine kinase